MMSSKPKNGWGRLALAGGLLATALLASCGGGGTEQTFFASRVISFGDENSVINTDGSKYTVNALATDGSLSCAANPIWVQSLASLYGLVFPECPGTVVGAASRIYATPGAKVADLDAQINAYLAAGGARASDMVTILVGVNDVVAQFAVYATDPNQAKANIEAAGRLLADQVNRIAELGAKVLIVDIPNMGRSPFAGDRTVAGNPNPVILGNLSDWFNRAMEGRLNNDGRKIGLVQFRGYLAAQDNAVVLGTGGASYNNTTRPACLSSAPLPTCTTATLDPAAAGLVWMWADDLHLGATGQLALGSFAVSRAQNNPF